MKKKKKKCAWCEQPITDPDRWVYCSPQCSRTALMHQRKPSKRRSSAVNMIDLTHGDCLEEMKSIPDGSVDLVLTDPPYGTTACRWDTVIPFEPMWEQLIRVTKKNGAIVLFGSQPFTSALVMSNPKMFKYEWVWGKTKPTGFPNANYMPLRNIEHILVFSEGIPNPMAKHKMAYYPQGVIPSRRVKFRNSKKGTVNNGENDGSLNGEYISEFSNYPRQLLTFSSESKTLHPTQKPVALMEYLIKTYTNKGETVLDFTMGSGTTGVAAKNLNRNFIGIELDEQYFEIAKARIDSTENTLYQRKPSSRLSSKDTKRVPASHGK